MLTFALCDLDGNRLSSLTDRHNARVELGFNRGRTAKVDVSVEDPAAQMVHALRCNLKVWQRQSLIFNGPVLQPVRRAGNLVEIPAVGPEHRLAFAFVHQLAKFTTQDQSEILVDLIAHADEVLPAGGRSHGIIEGSTPASVDRTRNYPDGKNIWEAILEMSEVQRGPDFEFEPLDRTDGIVAAFNTFYPDAGRDLAQIVRFEYAGGYESLDELTLEESGEIVNRATVGGKARKGKRKDAYIAEHKDSQREFGVFASFEVLSDVKERDTLQDHAERLVKHSAYPMTFIDFVCKPEPPSLALRGGEDVEPTFGNPPLCGPDDDFWLGDSCTFADYTGGFNDEHVGKITDLTLQENDQGDCFVSGAAEPRLVSEGITGNLTFLREEKAT